MSESRFQLGSKKLSIQGSYSWEIERRPGGWAIASRVDENGKKHQIRFIYGKKGEQVWMNLGGSSFYGKKLVKKRGSASHSDESDLIAQFPGKVRKILVQEGDQVDEGTDLLKVEAMKMEFTIKSPLKGKVKKLHVSEGEQLSPGTRYLDIEEKN
ncbi:MAG: hypothetical protein CL678_13220 [Bdellovibrionaceae bacterium]|nr:hypothetical protein [Pseudobdellovibrionaceae bacterium]|tara:strand:- start:398 stop:862 length:465 start_codon:yes stop_codon:yes gene_type:complete